MLSQGNTRGRGFDWRWPGPTTTWGPRRPRRSSTSVASRAPPTPRGPRDSTWFWAVPIPVQTLTALPVPSRPSHHPLLGQRRTAAVPFTRNHPSIRRPPLIFVTGHPTPPVAAPLFCPSLHVADSRGRREELFVASRVQVLRSSAPQPCETRPSLPPA